MSSVYKARCVLKTNEEIETCLAYKTYNHSQNSLAGVMREGFACTLLFLSVLSISSMHAASRLFSWAMEILPLASRHFAPKTVDLSVRFIHSHFVQFFRVSERSERRKTPAERSAF